ncbi:hypothetical protein [uncultured Flavobacterium sp.]|uniref:hypothetical protein n=1 Tax=uncultured Flavobacterium sp. TaxID=165435 RepID=UPI0025ED4EC2|nr:hypothetical protein [uncultured Flavobacterium sp.]
MIDPKEETEISNFENQLIQKGLKDILAGNVSSHEDVTNRFSKKFKQNNIK